MTAHCGHKTGNTQQRRKGTTMTHTQIGQNADACASQRANSITLDRTIGCGGCKNRWTGLNTCHCGACHRTFTGIKAFDIHRTGGRCTNPAEVFDKHGNPRLIPVDKPHWSGWRVPGDDTRWGTDER